MKKPNFFIIGAPKSGTTALSEYLRTNSQVFFSEPKEPHFFNEDFANRHTTNLSAYLDYFKYATDRHSAVGEGSVFYLRSTVAVPNVLAFQPNARFIVMLRNPVEMAPSWHSQAIYSFGEDVLDFSKAWHLQEERKLGGCLPRFCPEPKLLQYGDMCMLGDQMERLYKCVPSEQVKVIFFEDFVKDTQKVYEEALDFLGLEADRQGDFPQVNANKNIRSFRISKALQYIYYAKRKLGITHGLGIGRRITEGNTAVKSRRALPPDLVLEMKRFFEDDVLKLSKFTDRSLDHWVT